MTHCIVTPNSDNDKTTKLHQHSTINLEPKAFTSIKEAVMKCKDKERIITDGTINEEVYFY
jgi:hypothetical protein